MSVGLGAVFVTVTTAANAGVPADQAGLAAGLLNTSLQLGSALGLAVFSAIATARTNDLLTGHTAPAQALTAGFGRALLAGSIALPPRPSSPCARPTPAATQPSPRRTPARRCRSRTGPEVMNPTASDVVEEISAWAIGGGVLTAALFPFALPILLTVAFVLPFALAGFAIGVVAAVLAAPILLVRRLRSAMK